MKLKAPRVGLNLANMGDFDFSVLNKCRSGCFSMILRSANFGCWKNIFTLKGIDKALIGISCWKY